MYKGLFLFDQPKTFTRVEVYTTTSFDFIKLLLKHYCITTAEVVVVSTRQKNDKDSKKQKNEE
jgi:hypothetical protein